MINTNLDDQTTTNHDNNANNDEKHLQLNLHEVQGVSVTITSPFIHLWLHSPLMGPGLFSSSVIFFTQTVGLLGRVVSPSQGRYLHTE
jgi:hypothetical protein